jgi:antitoxin HigA-1
MAEEKNIHPGQVLKAHYLERLGLSQNALAVALKVPNNRILDIVRGRRGISAETDLLFARYFDTPVGYWLNLQLTHELALARRKIALALSKIVPLKKAAARK